MQKLNIKCKVVQIEGANDPDEYSNKSGVYSTQEIAIQRGKEWLEEKLEELHKNMDIEGTIEYLINWHAIYYDFKVTEIDPE